MERNSFRILLSLLLIGFGVLVLMENLNMLPFVLTGAEWFWALAFGAGGLVFLAAFATNLKENWWAAIPGFTLVGLGMVIGSTMIGLSSLGGGLFLGMIGLSFLVIYLTNRDFWWAVIPGGVLLTLSLVATTSEFLQGQASGGFFFLGLAATFLLVYVLPTREGRMTWAIWPASILGAMGLLLVAGAANLARFIWPLALILGGGLLVFRDRLPRRG